MKIKRRKGKALVVVDMQNDFVIGTLANEAAQAIVPAMAKFISEFDGDVYATRDTHYFGYLDTQEGKNLPIVHCVKGWSGWRIVPKIEDALHSKKAKIINKLTFGSKKLAKKIARRKYDSVELVGVCTDICVISNAAVIKAFDPEVKIIVHKALCAGVTPESHENALKAMAACQCSIAD